MSAPWAAPLWRFVFDRLPSLLLGARWSAACDCYIWRDLEGREVHIFESEPFAMIFATGQRVDYFDWLAARRAVPRIEIVRIFERAMAAEAPSAAVSLGDHPYSGGGEMYANAGEFARPQMPAEAPVGEGRP